MIAGLRRAVSLLFGGLGAAFGARRRILLSLQGERTPQSGGRGYCGQEPRGAQRSLIDGPAVGASRGWSGLLVAAAMLRQSGDA